MPRAYGLMKRKGSSRWYYRQRRPAHLMAPGLRPHEIISLGTSDYSEALTKLAAARKIVEDRFRAATDLDVGTPIISSVSYRKRPDALHLPLLGVEDASRLARGYLDRELLHQDLTQCHRGMFDGMEAQRVEQELDARIAVLSYVDDEDNEHPSLPVEVALLVENGFRSPYDSRASILLREYLRRAMYEIAKIARARFDGDFSVEIGDTFFNRSRSGQDGSVASQLVEAAATLTVAEASALFLGELLRRTRADKTQDRYRREIDHIVAFLGPDTPMGMVRRQQCVELRDTFARLPPNFGKLLGELTIQQLAARQGPDDPVLQWETHDKYLSMLRRLIAWAAKQDYLPKDYADDLKPLGRKPDASIAKLPFETTELARVFRMPIYTGCIDDDRGFGRIGPNIVRRSRYWAPLIALFSGLRAGEILQLTPAHFRRSKSGTHFIVLTSDMTLKNENAMREVPLHPMLIAIGLLSWVDRRRGQPDGLLFPEVPQDKYGAASATFSKRYRSDLKHLDLGKRRNKVTFHSYRHTFKRALDDADVGEQHKDELCGWSRGKKTGRRYGVGLSADVLRPYLESVCYDIDLSHLEPHAAYND